MYTFKASHSFNSSNNDSGYLFYNKKNFVTKKSFRIGRHWKELAEVVVHLYIKAYIVLKLPTLTLVLLISKFCSTSLEHMSWEARWLTQQEDISIEMVAHIIRRSGLCTLLHILIYFSTNVERKRVKFLLI